MPRRLVIFDCDGVLVDSEPISAAELLRTVPSLDEATIYRRFLGRSVATMAEILREEFGLDFTDADLEAMRGRLLERFRHELKPIAGVSDVLTGLGPRCVASSSGPERIRLSLEVTGLLEFFEPHIYSAAMVKTGKPAPDLFLHAARAMGTSPADCVVVEDSPAGIEAARRAGMRVLGFAGGSHAGPARLGPELAALGAEGVFEDMADLPALLRQLPPTVPAD